MPDTERPRFGPRYLRATFLAMTGFGAAFVGLAWALWGLVTRAFSTGITGLLCAALGLGLLVGGIALIGRTRRAEIAWFKERGLEPPRGTGGPEAGGAAGAAGGAANAPPSPLC
jgi:hypothetical protein